MGNKITVEGSIDVYFEDQKLYKKFVESEKEFQKKLQDIITQYNQSLDSDGKPQVS